MSVHLELIYGKKIGLWIGNRFSRGRGEERLLGCEGCDHVDVMAGRGAKVKAKRRMTRSTP